MRKSFRERLDGLRGAQSGFTLLELLIGMVIVAILVATASQMYLQHRRKAWGAQVRASIRNMAGAENAFVFTEGAPAFTSDLDDLHLSGYRWNEASVLPYVALATNQTYCIQVHSAHDSTIVWHFSSQVGYPEEGPATPAACGDPEVLGTYIAGLPPEGAGQDGHLSPGGNGTNTASLPPGGGGSGSEDDDGDSSTEEGEFGPGDDGSDDGSGVPGSDDDDPTSSTGSTPGYGTTDPTSGTDPGSGEPGSTTPTGSCGDGTDGGGSSTGTNHPSGKDRDTENGGSGSQGNSGSDPDGDENDGADKPGQGGGANTGDQDGNNGSGNDTDFEDDNRGPDRDGTSTPGSGC